MMISLRTKIFDASSPMEEGSFHGEDFAKWLQAKLAGWKTDVVGEDWGWAVYARKEGYRYNFGVYDHDTNDVTDAGPKWVLRLYNERDRSNWFKKMFKYIPPKAHPEVVEEITGILKADGEFKEIQVESL